MDKKKSPCGQIIENLDDFKYWLTYMEKLSGQLRPRVRHELINFINEALKLEHYDDDEVSNFVDAIDKLYTESAEKQIDRSIEGHNNFLEDSLDFRYSCEQRYGAETAFNEVYNDLENHINHLLNPLVNNDKNFHEFKQQALENLDCAKKNKFTNIEDSWRCLCLINRNIQDNFEYFKGKISKEQKSLAGQKLKLSGDKDAIIALIQQVNKKEVLKKTACLEATEIVYSKNSSRRVHHNTFTKWQKQYRENGDIELKEN